jgi:hypothetical protein
MCLAVNLFCASHHLRQACSVYRQVDEGVVELQGQGIVHSLRVRMKITPTSSVEEYCFSNTQSK